ncbi:MAG TPA: hypothetical protein VFA32_07255 [Dehalococcoidia bacterium]|nr:hypothetical protein [Dehalococcoidia bacterium]
MDLAKRVRSLERAVGAYDGGLCVCQPPNTFVVVHYPEREPHPAARDSGLCERCGRKKRVITLKVVFDMPKERINDEQ